jgi:alpha,alpha-trehalase
MRIIEMRLSLAPILLIAATSMQVPAHAEDAAARALRVAADANMPEDIWGELYRSVELARIFPDSKTFADMVPLESPEKILQAYRAEKPTGKEALAAFVGRYFTAVGAAPKIRIPLRAHIKALWPVLSRPPVAPMPGSSLLPVTNAYIVPGGRYQEFYYWDSYFAMLGMKADGQQPMVESMIATFVGLIERYGHIPNGTRTYYLGRSQPPFLALMMDLSADKESALARRRLTALQTEHAYWMAGSGCIGADGSCQHVVRMPDGSLLNRYWDARDTPRDESYTEDVATAAAAAPRPAAEINRHLRAGGESGWDFSSRWLRDGRTLSTIRTTDIVPIDLNSLLWIQEQAIARRCRELGDDSCARSFEDLAARRLTAMQRYLWNSRESRFADWDRSTRNVTPSVSAAMLVPLYAGLATKEQAAAVARLTRDRLLAPGGVRTTTVTTGQQWDSPNGWAPLQWMAIVGLDRYGVRQLARTIADRWLSAVSNFYCRTGRVIEKYDVETLSAGGGGEYVVQDGFGWTNGSVSGLMDRYGIEETAYACPQN